MAGLTAASSGEGEPSNTTVGEPTVGTFGLLTVFWSFLDWRPAPLFSPLPVVKLNVSSDTPTIQLPAKPRADVIRAIRHVMKPRLPTCSQLDEPVYVRGCPRGRLSSRIWLLSLLRLPCCPGLLPYIPWIFGHFRLLLSAFWNSLRAYRYDLTVLILCGVVLRLYISLHTVKKELAEVRASKVDETLIRTLVSAVMRQLNSQAGLFTRLANKGEKTLRHISSSSEQRDRMLQAGLDNQAVLIGGIQKFIDAITKTVNQEIDRVTGLFNCVSDHGIHITALYNRPVSSYSGLRPGTSDTAFQEMTILKENSSALANRVTENEHSVSELNLDIESVRKGLKETTTLIGTIVGGLGPIKDDIINLGFALSTLSKAASTAVKALKEHVDNDLQAPRLQSDFRQRVQSLEDDDIIGHVNAIIFAINREHAVSSSAVSSQLASLRRPQQSGSGFARPVASAHSLSPAAAPFRSQMMSHAPSPGTAPTTNPPQGQTTVQTPSTPVAKSETAGDTPKSAVSIPPHLRYLKVSQSPSQSPSAGR